MKILKVMTEHTTPFKTLIEVLKELLQEANLEFRMEQNKKGSKIDAKKQQPTKKTSNPSRNNKKKGKFNTGTNGTTIDEEEFVDSDDEAIVSDDDEIYEDDEEDDEEEEGEEEDDEEEDAEEEEGNEESETPNKNHKSKNGLRIMAVDTTKTVLINLKLDAENFTVFECKKKKFVLGVNLVYFYKLIKSLEKDDNLTLYVDHDDRNYLKIRADNPEKRKEDIFELKLLDLGTNPISVPDITFDAVITMKSDEFNKRCKEMNQIADYVEIKCLKNKVIFKCKGDNGGRTITYKTDDSGDSININYGGNNKDFIVQGIYELSKLVMFGKCSSLCNDIQIYMKNSYPLVIKYTVATLGRILLCLTPIEEDTTRQDGFSDDEYYSDNEVELLTKPSGKKGNTVYA